MTKVCDAEIFESSSAYPEIVRYAYSDRDGNGLIDPNELICKGRSKVLPSTDFEFDEDAAKWERLGTAASFYRKLIAGYSRTSDVNPHEMDDFFRDFSKSMSSDFYRQFEKELERAGASHKKNAVRDAEKNLDLFVRKGVLDFLAGDDESANRVEGEIKGLFETAAENGVKTEKYRAPLTASLRKAIKRAELQSKLDGNDRSKTIGALQELIQQYERPFPPEPIKIRL